MSLRGYHEAAVRQPVLWNRFTEGRFLLEAYRKSVSIPKVYVVDDDPLLLILVDAMLRAEGYEVETYESAEIFLESYSPSLPGCLILDVYLPGMQGPELQRQLNSMGNISPVIFLSGADQLSLVVSSMRDGAIDFIQKPVTAEKLLPVVERAMKIDRAQRLEYMGYELDRQRIAQLSKREQEVLMWIVRGESSKSIARICNISSRTVETHRSNISTKLEVHSVAELVRIGIRAGIS